MANKRFAFQVIQAVTFLSPNVGGHLAIERVTCAMVKSRYIGDGHPTFNRNPYNGYINPYY